MKTTFLEYVERKFRELARAKFPALLETVRRVRP